MNEDDLYIDKSSGPKTFIVKAEIELTVKAGTIPGAYNKFQKWIIEQWTKAIKEEEKGNEADLKPTNFHGISVIRVPDATGK